MNLDGEGDNTPPSPVHRVAVKSRKNYLGTWFWSHQAKLGKKKAIIAVSRKILSLAYTLIANDTLFDNDIAMRCLRE